MKNIMLKYSCPRCSGKEYEIGGMVTHPNFFSQITNLGFRKHSTVTCSRCKYTEIYKALPEELPSLFELQTGKMMK